MAGFWIMNNIGDKKVINRSLNCQFMAIKPMKYGHFGIKFS